MNMSKVDDYVDVISKTLEEFMKKYLVLGVERIPISDINIDINTSKILNDLGLLRLTNNGYLELKNPSKVSRSLCYLKKYDSIFPLITGYSDIKELICRSFMEKGINILFIGPPASGKTLFLDSIYLLNKDKGVYIDMTNTTSAGLLDLLYPLLPEVICIDEIDKPYDRRVFNTLTNILEYGNVVITKYNKTMSFKFTGSVYAGANYENSIPEYIRDRFLKIYLKPYTIDEIKSITVNVLVKFEIIKNESLANKVVEKGIENGIYSIRDLIKISKLVKTEDDLKFLEKIIGRIKRNKLY